jgi:hypothetical protein
VTLPAGTVLTVRTSTAIEAKSAAAGQTFEASLAQSITHQATSGVAFRKRKQSVRRKV